MPELPEVETVRAGLEPHLLHRRLVACQVYQPRLRYPVPADLAVRLYQQTIHQLSRRGKYLLLHCASGTLLIHLGMSGSLRLLRKLEPAGRHDQVDLLLDDGTCLRFHDPRRFGLLLWQPAGQGEHPLLVGLGPEPLSSAYTTEVLARACNTSRQAIKVRLMDSRVVVGVGNIYANEALFVAGIDPRRPAASLTRAELRQLVRAVKQVLRLAIAAGGTTLRDFVDGSGQPGYFSQQLRVYGREDEPCRRCQRPIVQCRLAQRSTYFCPHCQPPLASP